jgi:dihydroorotate dehydrogenase (NAD+) catalytic subunit
MKSNPPTSATPDLKTAIGGLILKNPVMTASGTFGYGEEYAGFNDLNRLGAIIVKGLSLEPRPGNPPPRIIETAAGMLNAIGLENVGVRAFIEDKLPFLARFDLPVIANIFGETLEEYPRVAEILSCAKGIAALEVNISCPNVKRGCIAFGADPAAAEEVTRLVKGATDLPVIVKLSPSVEAAGADGVSLINTITGMSVDVEKRIPHLKNITGGLSGPAIKPVALRMVWQVACAVKIPVIGVGGIMNAQDALEFLIVGARAIQVGTANFVNPRAATEILDGIGAYLRNHKIDCLDQLVGTLK